MKKIISVLTVIIFFSVSVMVYAGEDSWQESSDELGEKIGLSLVLGSVLVGLVALGITLTLKKSSRNDAAVIFSEATSSHGERSNLEILAKLYDITVEEVIDTISLMVVNGDIDMTTALANDDAARISLERLHHTLEVYSQKQGKNLHERLETLKEKFNVEFPGMSQKNQKEEQAHLPTTLELASFYRSFFKKVQINAK